jgi:cardiolipin synthase
MKEPRYPIQLLEGGDTSFLEITHCIQRSQKSILINMFIWRDDQIGNRIAQELVKAADRNVKITIYKDKNGAIFEWAEENRQSFFHKSISPFMWIQQAAVNWFYPVSGKAKNCKQRSNNLPATLNEHRNVTVFHNKVRKDHSKYYIFDNKTMILGGINVEDRALYGDVTGQQWKDYMIKIDSKQSVSIFHKSLKGTETNVGKLRFVSNTFAPHKSFNVKDVMLDIIASATQFLDIQMAYIGDGDISQSLLKAASKGVEVSIIIPKKANVLNDLNIKILLDLFNSSNGKIHTYISPYMLHAKVMIVDKTRVLTGSANMNPNSTSKIGELSALSDEKNLVTSFVNSFDKHRKQSELITNAEQLPYNRIRAFFEGLIS